MIAYLDTNAVIRLSIGGKPRLSRETSRLIEEGELRISPMVLLELELLNEIRRIKYLASASAALYEKWTRDPFDRIIVAHAKINGLAPLISSDEKIAAHYPRTIW
jgi:PIN domain nuclease of toxin-antitoxin system